MKTLLKHATDARIAGSGLRLAIASLLLTVLPLAVATPPAYTGTGYLVGVPVPGILCTNASGQVSLKGNVHVLRVQVDDPRLTGRFQATMDLAYQADGTALFGGAAYQEVGTWDLADPKNPKFTPSTGMWQCNYHGVAQPDGSDVITLTGYGVGGAIDGLRLEETITKGPGVPFDPAIPYLGAATIKPAPVNTRVVVDDFADNRFTWTAFGAGAGTFTAIETNQQLTIRGNWHSPTVIITDWCAWANPSNSSWAVRSGQTIEVRVDLVSLNPTATASLLALYHQAGQAYVLAAATNWIGIWKQYLPGNACFRVDKVTTKNTNVVLVLALTPVGQNVVVTAKVLDKDSGAVLYQGSIVDTPASDPTLTRDEVAQVTGGRLWQDDRSDPSGAPWTSGSVPFLGVFQDTDGTKPAAEATFDNLELRTYEVPQVGIERAVQLTWPAPAGMNYAVEGGPTVQGPWLPVNDVATPGWQQITVPANDVMKFFRLQQAP